MELEVEFLERERVWASEWERTGERARARARKRERDDDDDEDVFVFNDTLEELAGEYLEKFALNKNRRNLLWTKTGEICSKQKQLKQIDERDTCGPQPLPCSAKIEQKKRLLRKEGKKGTWANWKARRERTSATVGQLSPSIWCRLTTLTATQTQTHSHTDTDTYRLRCPTPKLTEAHRHRHTHRHRRTREQKRPYGHSGCWHVVV